MSGESLDNDGDLDGKPVREVHSTVVDDLVGEMIFLNKNPKVELIEEQLQYHLKEKKVNDITKARRASKKCDTLQNYLFNQLSEQDQQMIINSE